MLRVKQIESDLLQSTFVSRVCYFKELDSTNDYCKTLQGEDNVLVITDNQLKGRGRFERTWESEPGSNLTFSLRKKIEVENNMVQSVNFFFTYCLYDCLLKYISSLNNGETPNLSIKWPNDIHLDGKKLSGTLIEKESGSDTFIIGFGINVNQVVFPLEYSFKTTSIRIYSDKYTNLENLLENIIMTFHQNMIMLDEKHYDRIFENWKRSSSMIGKTVLFVTSEKGEKMGKVLDFTKDGGIKILTSEKEEVYYSGDIRISNGF